MICAPCREGITVITGTDTDVGKTIATAVIAAQLQALEIDVAVLKPAQTGLSAGEEGDVQLVGRYAGLPSGHCYELARLPEPLAPTTAARRAGIALPSITDLAAEAVRLANQHRALLIEGAGGVLVGLDGTGKTLLDLADSIAVLGMRTRFVVVARAGLGALNHTALTSLAIREAGHHLSGVVIGAMAPEPDLATSCNLHEIADAAQAPLLGVLPAGIGTSPTLLTQHALLDLGTDHEQ